MIDNAQNTVPQIPQSIVLGGTTYNVDSTPELKEFLASVAKVEKHKVHTKFAELQKKVEELTVQGIPPSLNIQEIVDALKGSIETVIDTKFTEMQGALKPVIDKTEADAKQAIENYREKLLKDNEGACIPELVKGSTKEELDRTLAESKTIYQQYGLKPASTAPPAPANVPAVPDVPAPQRPTAPPAAPAHPARAFSSQLENVKNLSPEEFAKKRESLLGELQAEVNN